MANYESDEPFALSLREQFDRAEYDLVMTVNFFLLYPMNVKKKNTICGMVLRQPYFSYV